MKLYYSKGTCSLAIRIAIHEIGAPCEFEAVNLHTKETETGGNFFEINPKGAVPTVITDHGETLTENTVIQQYLADTFKATQLLPSAPDFNRYRVLEWLNFVSTDLHKNCTPYFISKMPDAIKKDIYEPILISKFTLVDKHLAQHKFLMGEDFCLADGYMYVVMRWLPHLGIDRDQWPNITRYFNEVGQRPAVQQALSEEGLS